MKYMFLELLLGFVISAVLCPFVIKLVKKWKGEQTILEYVDAHAHKKGTATMGGMAFIFATIVAILPLVGGHTRLASIVLVSMLGYGLLGFLDDFIKVKMKQNLGLRAYQKVIGQVGIAVLIAVFAYLSPLVGSSVRIPFSDIEINLYWGIIPFIVLFFVAFTNSVNLTDGLDGLATGVTLAYLFGFIGILAVTITKMENSGESLVLINEYKNILYLSGGFAGSLLAFLMFNGYPAKVFMGDTGSLAIGGFLSAMAVLTREYLLVPILGLMFVVDCASVIIQVLVYKRTKKRVFLMAPLHHHFEKKGSYETKIVTIYILITLFISVGCLALYL